jgi:4-amino-4-deoxy-L-arabinose transferase-like glycosyltransferase
VHSAGLFSEVQSRPSPAGACDWRRAGLVVVIVIAAVIRLTALPAAPPGLNQDEAANAWNAWCLLQTGRDQAGAPWPIFWTHALGADRSTLYLYTLLPFQAIGGLNVWTTRLPAAVGGILTVVLIGWIATRLFDRTTGLVAAGIAAFAPWYIDLSRWGHEASVGPLLSALSLAALLWAGLLGTGRDQTAEPPGLAPAATRRPHWWQAAKHQPRWWRGALAGVLSGAACYGYPAVRIYLPLLLFGALTINAVSGRRLLRSRAALFAATLFCAGFAVTFGPLLYQHVVNPEMIARRASSVWLWQPGEPALAKAAKVAARYAAHFAPSTLAFTGLDDQQRGPLGFGAFSWYVLPLLLAGLVLTLPRLRRSHSARLLMLGILLYPAGDCLHRYSFETAEGLVDLGPHILRSAPGLWALVILAAVGGVGLARWLWRLRPNGTKPVLAVAIAAALLSDAVFLAFFFGPYRHRPAVIRDYHADLVEALRWARPRIHAADAVFITASGMNMPYVITLVMTGYDPHEWFKAERDVRTFSESEFEYYFRVGRFYFVYDASSRAALHELRQNERPDRVLFIMRPEEMALRDPLYTVRGPDGQVALAVFEATL